MKFVSVVKSIRGYFSHNDFLFLLILFFVWRIYLLAELSFSGSILPLQNHFLGGGMKNYLTAPYMWGLANFDGEHFIAIAKFGYQPLTYFFFPLYPMLISLTTDLVGKTEAGYLFSGLFISNLSFLFAIFGLWKLLLLDNKRYTVLLTTSILLLFPTSFYFVTVYSESLFLLLVVWSFYFARKQNWALASILALLATGTRVIGIVMLPALICEYLLQTRKFKISSLILLFIPMGLVAYMIFLQNKTGDPLTFLHSVEIYGPQRSSTFILLPQVFYRYIFKILPGVGFSYWPVTLITWLEFIIGVSLLIISLISFVKIRLSYAIYLFGGYIIPTLSGSFSSLPRYSIVLFPAFLAVALAIKKLPKPIALLLILSAMFLLTITQTLFLRGYWVS